MPCPPVISSEAKRSREISQRKVSCRKETLWRCAGWETLCEQFYRGETRWCHVGQETICEQFPAAMKHNRAMPSRKPFAGCFPPTGIYEKIPYLMLLPRSFAAAQDDRWEAGRNLQNTVVSCRVGNPSRTVSCRGETLRCHAPLSFRAERSAVEKSPGEKFPAEAKRYGAMPDRKLYAKSFLL